ncbi:phage major tail protein, TP901-1 family [Paenibacillus larvae]|nr:phage major tail protein, TP901-1 family [Paenibacillus larvae]MDT2304975.1 phage major tail protein, TP901-1 family [Paenibacillus larvae]
MQIIRWKRQGEGKILAGQRSATISRSAETIDATSKDTEGYWKRILQGFKEWSIDADGVFVESDQAYYKELEDAWLNSENVKIYIELPGRRRYAGEATITDASLEMPYDDLVTYSLSFQGSGALQMIETIPGKRRNERMKKTTEFHLEDAVYKIRITYSTLLKMRDDGIDMMTEKGLRKLKKTLGSSRKSSGLG